jgi:ferric-dicitrate binding protein FerR (iron transport regulator)
MSDALAGDVRPEELAQLESHASACAACRVEFDRLLLQDRALAELVGETLEAALRERIRERLASEKRGLGRRLLVGFAAGLPFLITAVLVWKLGRSDRLPPIATIVEVTGEVFLTQEDQSDRAAIGSGIAEGEGIQSRGPRSRAVVRFSDGSELELEGNTRIDRLTAGSADRGAGKEVALAHGWLGASVVPQPPGRPMTLISPQARASVVGTRLRLLAGSGSTRLEVDEGKVRLTRPREGDSVDVPAGQYAVAAPGAPLVARPLPRTGKSTLVQAGETLTLSEDLVLADLDTLEIRGTAERPSAIAGNHHRIRTSGDWTGKLRITHCEIRDLGDRVSFSPEGRIVSQSHAFDLSAVKEAQIAIEQSTFRASSSVRLKLEGASSVRFVGNLSGEDSIVWVDKAVERTSPFFEATGGSKGELIFQGNRIYRSGIHITGKGWTIGGESDAQSNLVIGLRAGLFAYGEGTVVRGNYVHVLMPRTPEFPYWSQVATFTSARGALAEHNVIRDGEWIVQFVEGEFRHNLICDINDHNLLRNGSTGRIHHNLFVAGKPDHPPGQMNGCIFIVYAPKDGQEGAEIWNNTFDASGQLNVPGIEVNPGGWVKSLRNNVFYNFAHEVKFISSAQAMVRPIWNEPLTEPGPARLGYADFNAFYSPQAKVKRNYALSVAGKTERKDAGFALNDLPRGGLPNDQVDPRFRGPLPAVFAFKDEDIKGGQVTVSKILAFYREAYTPAPGSPLIGAGDPADGPGTDIGAVPAPRGASGK